MTKKTKVARINKVGPANNKLRKEIDSHFKNTFCFNCGYGSSRVEKKIKWKKDLGYINGYITSSENMSIYYGGNLNKWVLKAIDLPSLKEAKRIAELINQQLKW